MLDKEYETNNHEEELDAFCHVCDNIENCISNKEKHKKYSKISGPINPQYSNKLDQIIDILLSDLDPKEVWHLIFNKMTNPAKRQLIGELLNTCIGTTYSATGKMFEDAK